MTANHTAVRSFRAIGTTAVVAVTDRMAAGTAESLLRAELQALDEACSRFRPDAELAAVQRRAGTAVPVSDLLFDVLTTACDVARLTDGAVDPTVGRSLEALGYDRDFALIGRGGGLWDGRPWPAPGWRTIELDHGRRTVCLPPGVHVDVGSSAKAFAADRAAWRIAGETGAGVVVSLGGDVATAGPPPDGGWPVGIARDCAATVHAVDQVITVFDGGVASSSPGVRSWRHGHRTRHHIVDPRTGACAPDTWSLVSVLAPTCVDANALSTAAVVWGPAAVDRLAKAGFPARLVRADGEVVTLHGWPGAPAGHPSAPAGQPGRHEEVPR